MRWTIGAILVLALGLAPAAGALPTAEALQLDGPDVSIKAAAPATAQHGKLVTYMVTVWNAGPDAATDVVVTDQLWNGARVVAIARSQGSYALEHGKPTSTITWELDELAAGGSAVLTFVVRPAARGHLANTVAVTAPGDPDATGNAAELHTVVA